jgi:hypothetical protein
MTIQNNFAGLRVVREATLPDTTELLIPGASPPRRVRVEQRDVPRAQIATDLAGHCCVTGRLIRDYGGVVVETSLPVLFKGQTVQIVGEPAVWLEGVDVVVPRGWSNGA